MATQASVTIPYTEFQALQDEKRAAEQEAATLKQKIIEQKIESSDQATLAVARAALQIVRFAVGSMPPESTKGWPVDDLRKVAENLTKLPDAVVDDQDLAMTLSIFANECEMYERRRQAFAKVGGEVVY